MFETLVSKSEFAARVNISPGRVSQLISEGKITGDAIRGEGRSARLVFERAIEQFRGSRNVGQALGNGAHARTFLPTAPAMTPETAAPPPPSSPPLPERDPVAERIQKERLEQERIKTVRLRREEAVAEGRYMLADDVRAQMSQMSATLVRIFEGGLADIASALSSRFEVPQRDVMHELQKAFREVRERASTEHRQAAAELPEHIEDSGEDDADIAGQSSPHLS